MKVYVDDMLVKSRASTNHLADLKETFNALRKHKMRLNPTKCAFGVTSEKFLRFMVSRRGIEANPEKIRAIWEMTAPKTIKKVQRLTGKVASLNRFVSRSTERCTPFFQVFRRPKDFCWTVECQRAFEELKNYLGSPLLLAKPEFGEELFLYLAVSLVALAAVLVKEEARTQRSVYYMSWVLRDAEIRYSRLKKLTYSLLVAAKRLRPCFQEHTVTVLTDQPIKAVLHRTNAFGRIAKWAIELTEFDINYQPRPSIKA
ncbi:putative mitochondrial protein [Cocos nucifera]|uniref:Putative mitochondrial protein n=1 Tax=Cocos nucifera TaxID=13894 RepID=A0A8K0MWP1_COCNU|nr:putative mitochondrial protein [Cocos nucifera]